MRGKLSELIVYLLWWVRRGGEGVISAKSAKNKKKEKTNEVVLNPCWRYLYFIDLIMQKASKPTIGLENQ